MLLTFVIIVASVSVFATDYTSNNVSGNWSSAASWSPSGVPTAGDNVTIAQGTITVDISSSVSNITIGGGTLKLNAGLTVTGAWLYNSGTFTPNAQTVTFGTGGSIGGTLTTTFRNLKISTTSSTDVVTLLTSGMNIQNASGGGVLTLDKGIFNIGSGNVINMIGGGGGNTINNPNATGTSNLATTNSGADGGSIIFTSGNPVTVNGPGLTTFYNLSSTSNPSFTITTANTVLINGRVNIRTGSTGLHFSGSNAPIYGPTSLLFVDFAGQGYNPGLEWSASSGTIGVSAGYPNDVTLTNIGSSSGGYNNGNGWVPNTTLGINGVLTLGDNVTNAQADFSNVPSFVCGGFKLNANSRFVAPKAVMTVNGNWTDNQVVSGTNKGFFINGTSTVVFGGAGTCTSPNTISAPTGNVETFNNLTIAANVSLLSPVTLNATGFFSLNSGILTTTSSNILTINNTSTAAIAGGSGTSYINGPVKWSLAATANVYNFPVGGDDPCIPYYMPFTLNNVAANATFATVQAFKGSTGGTVDGTISAISATEYWSLKTAANLNSGSTVSVAINRLTPITAFNFIYIAKSNTLAGVYTSIGGTGGPFSVTNSNDIGAASQYFFVLSAPPIISTLAATSVTTNSATLQGAFNTQNNSRTTSFTYGTNTSVGLGVPTTIHSPINSTTSVLDSAIITGLTANTLYTFKATDGVNNGSDVTFITAPNPPTIGVGTNPTATSFTANWSAPSVPGTAVYTYTIQVSTDPTFTTGVTTQTGIPSTTTSFIFTNLTAATEYYYHVQAVNATASSVWSATSVANATNVVPSPACDNNTSNDGATTFTSAAPIIDGTVDAVWATAPSNAMNVVTLGTNNNTQNWKSLWTADSLYLLVQVTDASLIGQGASLAGSVVVPGVQQSASNNYYEADGIEFYLDADNSHGNNYDGINDVQLRFNLGSNVISGQSTGGATQFVGAAFLRVQSLINWKMKVVPGGYLLEAALPWGKDAANPGVFLLPNNTYGNPTGGQTVGLDIGINDQDNTGGGRQAQIQWFGNSAASYQHPDQFKSVGLQVCPVAPVVTTPTRSAITATSAVLGATVVSSGKDAQLNISPLISRGSAFNTSLPVISNAHAEGGTAIGVYAGIRTGLSPQTKYYYEGYANNAAGLTGVSTVDSFYTLSALPTVQPTLSTNTCSSITLNWNAITFPPVDQATRTGYLVLRRQDGSNPTSTGIATRVATKQSDLPAGTTLLATINSGSTITFTDPTAVTGTTYNYLLVPFTWDGVVADSTFNYFTSEASTISASIGSLTKPTFNTVPAICIGGALSPLPNTSINQITGTWLPALNNLSTTKYVFTPTAGQCADTTSLTITVNQLVVPTFNPIASICAGSSLSPLPTTSTNLITGTWSPALNNLSTTKYKFTPTAGQCADTASLTIVVNQLVIPTFNPVAAICAGSSLSPLPTTSTNLITGTWSPALNNLSTTRYKFTPTAGQCADTASLTITVNQLVEPSFNQVAAICAGANLSALPTTSLNQITGIWSPALSNTDTKIYTFTPASGQCADTASLTITVHPLPLVNASANPTQVSQGAMVTLTGTSSIQGLYSWSSSPFTSIESSGSLTTTSNPTENTTYTLTVTDEFSCVASDEVSVSIYRGNCLNPPNVFTPNSDGHHDVWEVYTSRCFKKIQVDVFNRWGGNVFHSDDYNNNWNGTCNGKPLPDATYYYIIKATLTDGSISPLSGNVTIMR